MLTPDGKKTAAVDLMSEYWTGAAPDNLCPRIESLTLQGSNIVDEKNTNIKLKLVAADPENQPLSVKWKVTGEAGSFITMGDYQKAPPSFDDAIKKADNRGAEIQLPTEPGIYRIYAYVQDEAGGAATANVPVQVKGEAKLNKVGKKSEIPFVVYDEPDQEMTYLPSGYMGKTEAIKLDLASKDQPKQGASCLKCEYKRGDEWGGVVWQHPENDWGDKPGGRNLSDAKKLTFWVRSPNEGDKVTFGFGLLGRDKTYYDTAKQEMEVTLTKEWKQYTFDLSKADLQRIKTGFYWSLAGQGKPITFYLDRIVFE